MARARTREMRDREIQVTGYHDELAHKLDAKLANLAPIALRLRHKLKPPRDNGRCRRVRYHLHASRCQGPGAPASLTALNIE